MPKPKTRHRRAALARTRRLTLFTELLTACACEFPLVQYRNMHGHGKTIDGKPCPAIAVWERQHGDAGDDDDDDDDGGAQTTRGG